MLKCRSRPTASPPMRLRSSRALDPIGARRDDDRLGLEGDERAIAVAADDPGRAARRAGRSARRRSPPAPRARRPPGRGGGRRRAPSCARRSRSRCCSSRCRGRRPVMFASISSSRPASPSARHRVAEAAGRGAGAVGADRLDAQVGADGAIAASSPPRSIPGAAHVGEHGGRRLEAEAVVDRRPAADAHPLQHLQAEVRGELERALVVELEVLADLVVGEGGGVDVRAALEHEHPAAGGREAARRGSSRRRRSRRRSRRGARVGAAGSERSRGGAGAGAGVAPARRP